VHRSILCACRPAFQQVLKTALTPIINMLSIAGLISIPGMMTGQILAGGALPHDSFHFCLFAMLFLARQVDPDLPCAA
jgi:putative ABC transport system permease protein